MPDRLHRLGRAPGLVNATRVKRSYLISALIFRYSCAGVVADVPSRRRVILGLCSYRVVDSRSGVLAEKLGLAEMGGVCAARFQPSSIIPEECERYF
jgi:hypothetical protein